MKIMRQLKHKDKRRKPRPFHVHNGRLLFSGVSKHALTTKGQDLLSNKRKKFTGFLMAVYIRQQVQSNNTTDGAVTSTFAIKMSFKLLVYMEKIVQQRGAIRVRWVVEFSTQGYKISLILQKETMGSKKMALTCELTQRGTIKNQAQFQKSKYLIKKKILVKNYITLLTIRAIALNHEITNGRRQVVSDTYLDQVQKCNTLSLVPQQSLLLKKNEIHCTTLSTPNLL